MSPQVVRKPRRYLDSGRLTQFRPRVTRGHGFQDVLRADRCDQEEDPHVARSRGGQTKSRSRAGLTQNKTTRMDCTWACSSPTVEETKSYL
ncbi:hypothetical protein NPIL_321501 [Nephila pilipes]|uniref:Uncharacterized protein n=1 Tax=Nephila pilipes TaxID=299642 RepID=A0A8X6UK04_NEPPI|nr:hypothetical protein NPIL_321501 [Nephila pilipes]